MAASAISATSSTDTQYPVLINGYLCYSAAEVRVARQSINPRTIDKATGLPEQTRADETATSTKATSYLDTLRTYTAQGASADEEQRRRRGAVLDILA